MNNKQHLQALTNAGISTAHVASGGVFLVLHVAINQYLKAVSRNPEMYLSAADLKKLKAFSGYMSALDTSTTKVYVAYREAGILLPEMEYLIEMNKKEFKLEELLERQEKGHAEKLEASDTSHEIKQMEKKLGMMTTITGKNDCCVPTLNTKRYNRSKCNVKKFPLTATSITPKTKAGRQK